jgi:hypothetical protein
MQRIYGGYRVWDRYGSRDIHRRGVWGWGWGGGGGSGGGRGDAWRGVAETEAETEAEAAALLPRGGVAVGSLRTVPETEIDSIEAEVGPYGPSAQPYGPYYQAQAQV